MTWYRSLGITELLFILAFAGLYAAYLWRMYRIGQMLRVRKSALFAKMALRSLIFALMIIALLGPSFGDTSREIKAVGKDIFICADLSESMNAIDVQPSRLERVKFELKRLSDAFASDRIGLIIFSSEAFVQCPLTYDRGAIHLFIESLSTNLVPSAGTDFGPPLQMALEKLGAEEGTITQQKSKIIVLISDGEDFGEETEGVARNIADAGIRLYTLGVGTEEGSRIRTVSGFKTDRSGREVISRLHSSDLKNLADITGGKYFEINASRNDTERLINTINSIEGEIRDTRRVDASANKYFYFAALALLLLSADVVFGFRSIRL
jgi:Ca-activated chloride channel homolog